MARFFIDRPIFAWVLAIVIMLAGALAITRLPLEQYPDIAPPTVRINATYTGASAQTIEDSVTQVIEQSMTGLDNLQYMSSSSSSAGSASVQLTFAAGTDADTAQVQVQNKLQLAMSRLPQAVQNLGVTVTKSGGDIFMVVAMTSEDGSMSRADIADYISSTLEDPITRLNGVGDVQAMGSQYAMRIWLDPNKMDKYDLMPSDISAAVEAQNTEVAAGQIGALPAVKGQQLNATITARSRLRTADQFKAIVLKTTTAGAVVHLGDVARVELGSEDYDTYASFNGKPTAGMGIKLATGANALAVSTLVNAKLAELGKFFPKGLKATVAYDTTPFVRISIDEVVKTLFEAVVLVVLIMFLFLQNLRATLIPAIAVPVVLLGTFGVLALCGYSINTLTMFGMVLAIGLLVDDAIVVVENVERIIHEEGLPPRDATRKSMGEITSALIGIALVLSAVMVPMAFFSGSTGIIYRQFSITVVSAMLLSVVVALTITPALCASILKPSHAKKHGLASRFGERFNRGFDRVAGRCSGWVGAVIRRRWISVAVYLLVVAAMAVLMLRLPTSFMPTEDQGTLMVQVQLPSGATQQRTLKVMDAVQRYFNKQPDVASVFSVGGFSFGGSGQNSGMAFIKLKDWGERSGSEHTAQAIAGRAMRALSSIRDASVFVMSPPAIHGLGQSSGFDVELEDLGGLGHDKLVAARQQFLALAAKDPLLAGVRYNGLDDTPQLEVNVDDNKAGALGLGTSDINDTLASVMGGTYIDDFINNGRVKKVYMQADAPFRMLPQDIGQWRVRNSSDQMVPFSAFASTKWSFGPSLLGRYNGESSFELVGDPAPGVSSGDAMNEVGALMKKLPQGIGYEWTGLSYQEQLSGSQAPALYAISILFVFLCLAALYESWSIPFSVLLVVPLGILGALLASTLRGFSNDVYFQVGLLTTVGLSAKNAILVVEFAEQMLGEGRGLIDATLHAVRMRLRPIVMTSIAFMLGVLPLAISSGAGSASRQDIGTGVLGGMITSTLLGVLFVPLFFVLIRSRFPRKARPVDATEIAS